MAHKTIKEALVYVSAHPEPSAAPIDMPVWELVCRELYRIANSPDPKVRGAMTKATKAQSMILDRVVGLRRPGTQPQSRQAQQVTFVDLTAGLIEEGSDEHADG